MPTFEEIIRQFEELRKRQDKLERKLTLPFYSAEDVIGDGLIGKPQLKGDIRNRLSLITRGVTKVVALDGTGDFTDIQSAINALPSSGGKIVVREGTYTLTERVNYYGNEWACINITKPVCIQGMGRNKTILRVANNIYANAIGSRMVDYIQIEDLTIDGNRENNANQGVDGNQNGIYTGAYLGLLPNYLVYRNLEIMNCPRQGIYIGANSYQVHVENILAHDNGLDGVVLDQTYGGTVIGLYAARNNLLAETYHAGLLLSTDVVRDFNVTVLGGTYEDNRWAGISILYARNVALLGPRCERNGVTASIAGYGIHVLNSNSINIFSPQLIQNRYSGLGIFNSSYVNTFSGTAKDNSYGNIADPKHGVQIWNGTSCLVNGLRAFDEQETKTQLYGIKEEESSDYNTFRDNDVSGNAIAGILKVGVNTKLINNRGYVTENSGTSTGTGAQQTIAHGLAATPTLVLLSDKDNGALPYQSAAANTTNIYITAVNTKAYTWKAEV